MRSWRRWSRDNLKLCGRGAAGVPSTKHCPSASTSARTAASPPTLRRHTMDALLYRFRQPVLGLQAAFPRRNAHPQQQAFIFALQNHARDCWCTSCYRPSVITRLQAVAPASSDRSGAEKPKKPVQTKPTPMAAAAAMKRTMKMYAKVVVELSKAAAVLLVLRNRGGFQQHDGGHQSCKEFTKTSHIKVEQTNDKEATAFGFGILQFTTRCCRQGQIT